MTGISVKVLSMTLEVPGRADVEVDDDPDRPMETVYGDTTNKRVEVGSESASQS